MNAKRRWVWPIVTRHLAARGIAGLLAATCSLLLLSEARAAEQPVVRLGLAVHVPRERQEPVVSEAFIQRQVAMANRVFAPYGVAFERREHHERAARHARMETRADRNALSAFVRPRLINVFMVASLRDVDEPKRMRRGVHWHSSTHPRSHYVILSSISFDAVLAHELGHFLGNRSHSTTPGNLMSYRHTDVLPFLDETQQRRLRQRLADYLRTGELVALGDPRADAGAGP